MSSEAKPYCVYPRSRRQIEAVADAVRLQLGIGLTSRIALQPILEFALDGLVEDAYYDVEFDNQMGGAEGRTDGEKPVITLSASTYMSLSRGSCRARMTVAHELGHLLLHSGQRVFHFTDAVNDNRFDPEWQADQFAAALLMPREAFGRMRSVREAMTAFGVSKAAAIRRARVVGIRLQDGSHTFGRHRKKGHDRSRTP